MLVVTNGSSAVAALTDAGIPGDKLSWDDVLHDGPVPEGLELTELSATRARFIADCGWGAQDDVRAAFRARDARLAAAAAEDEVVLWFEHDLYDQLQLLQLLDWFARPSRRPGALTLVCHAAYVALEPAAALGAAFARREPVTGDQLDLARDAWAAFRAPDPGAWAAVASTGATLLPFLGAAVRRMLEEFPAVGDGLGRTERQALASVRERPGTRRADAFADVQRLEEPAFLGDASFFRHLEALGSDPLPLLVTDEGGGMHLTRAGDDVLAGKADRVRLRGIERWYGGVRLTGGYVWRWNPEAGTVERE